MPGLSRLEVHPGKGAQLARRFAVFIRLPGIDLNDFCPAALAQLHCHVHGIRNHGNSAQSLQAAHNLRGGGSRGDGYGIAGRNQLGHRKRNPPSDR